MIDHLRAEAASRVMAGDWERPVEVLATDLLNLLDASGGLAAALMSATCRCPDGVLEYGDRECSRCKALSAYALLSQGDDE